LIQNAAPSEAVIYAQYLNGISLPAPRQNKKMPRHDARQRRVGQIAQCHVKLFVSKRASIRAAAIHPASGAGWPNRVFAPYMYLGTGDQFQLARCDDECGQIFYPLAFIIAAPTNQPAWDRRFPMEENLYADQITTIRARGDDVIVSFGGEAGKELALTEPDAARLQAQYQFVIDRYQFTGLDFDIEGKALENARVNAPRNTALAGLQAPNPALIISYTLPVDPPAFPMTL
jgi:hypothetical protein